MTLNTKTYDTKTMNICIYLGICDKMVDSRYLVILNTQIFIFNDTNNNCDFVFRYL